MNKSNCSNCDCELEEDEVRWAYDEIFCESCLNERYRYCDQCDVLVAASDAHFNADGYPFCSECYQGEYDEDCPENPDVDAADRKLIIQLSRNFLLGKVSKKSVVKINQNDFMLPKIKEKVGVVENPVYLFGLMDREEYHISVSPNLLASVKEYILLHGFDWKVTEGIGCNRMGICYSLRKNHFAAVLKLIKIITSIRETLPA